MDQLRESGFKARDINSRRKSLLEKSSSRKLTEVNENLYELNMVKVYYDM